MKKKLIFSITLFCLLMSLGIHPTSASYAATKASVSDAEKNDSETLVLELKETCRDVLENLEHVGIRMSVANDKNSIRAYVLNLLPVPDFEYSTLDVAIYNSPSSLSSDMDFKPAVAGTRYNRNGTDGQCYISIILSGGSLSHTLWIDSGKIRILPTTYTASSNSSSSGGNSHSHSSKQSNVTTYAKMSVSKPSAYDGTWEFSNNKWRLHLNDNVVASNQWAFIKDKWYLFDSTGYMITGWKMVNGKWYYLESSGEMATGWRLIDNKYYFLSTDGSMLQNTITPDGYKVNQTGEWIN